MSSHLTTESTTDISQLSALADLILPLIARRRAEDFSYLLDRMREMDLSSMKTRENFMRGIYIAMNSPAHDFLSPDNGFRINRLGKWNGGIKEWLKSKPVVVSSGRSRLTSGGKDDTVYGVYTPTSSHQKVQLMAFNEMTSFVLSGFIPKWLKSKRRTPQTEIEAVLLKAFRYASPKSVRSVLVHELQHAYDDWRSSSFFLGKSPEHQAWVSHMDRISQNGDLSPGDTYRRYLNLPYEIWARFAGALTGLFRDSNSFNKPFPQIASDFQKSFRGWSSLSSDYKRRLIKGLYKYYSSKGKE